MSDVFISYSTKDQKLADSIFSHLTAERLNVFMASISLKLGKSWSEENNLWAHGITEGIFR